MVVVPTIRTATDAVDQLDVCPLVLSASGEQRQPPQRCAGFEEPQPRRGQAQNSDGTGHHQYGQRQLDQHGGDQRDGRAGVIAAMAASDNPLSMRSILPNVTPKA